MTYSGDGWLAVRESEWERVRLALEAAEAALGDPPEGCGRAEMEGARAFALGLLAQALVLGEVVSRRKVDGGGA